MVYQAQPDFDIDEYLKSGAFGYRLGEQQIELVAKIRPEIAWLLSETPVSEQQSLSEPDNEGWVILKAIVPDDLETQWWVMGFGADIEVIEPFAWRERIKDLANELKKLYGQTGERVNI